MLALLLPSSCVHDGVPPKKGGRAWKPVVTVGIRLPADVALCGVGWQSVCALWRGGAWGCVQAHPPAMTTVLRFPAMCRPAAFVKAAGSLCLARRPAMNASDVPPLRAQYAPANADESEAAKPDPNNLIALLHQIGRGVAADGQPWPERHQLPGRCLALADRWRVSRPAHRERDPCGRRACPTERWPGALRGRPRDGRVEAGRVGADQPRYLPSAPGVKGSQGWPCAFNLWAGVLLGPVYRAIYRV